MKLRHLILAFIVTLFLVVAGCSPPKPTNAPETQQPAQPQPQQTQPKASVLDIGKKDTSSNVTIKQISSKEYSATASVLVEKYSEILLDLAAAINSYNYQTISKDDFNKLIGYNRERIQMLTRLVSDLDRESLSIYYPGERTHLTTYFLNALREHNVSLKYLQEGDINSSMLWQDESGKDYKKFLNGVKQL